MYKEKKIFLDFDGVILDSEQRIVDLKDKNPTLDWEEFFANIDWKCLYETSSEINESLKVIKELQRQKTQLYILSKVHTLLEGQTKIDFLRKHGIEIPILLTPPDIKKSMVYLPNDGSILVDDSYKNIVDWNQNGGHGILFLNDDILEDEEMELMKITKVKSLKFLLK